MLCVECVSENSLAHTNVRAFYRVRRVGRVESSVNLTLAHRVGEVELPVNFTLAHRVGEVELPVNLTLAHRVGEVKLPVNDLGT